MIITIFYPPSTLFYSYNPYFPYNVILSQISLDIYILFPKINETIWLYFFQKFCEKQCAIKNQIVKSFSLLRFMI